MPTLLVLEIFEPNEIRNMRKKSSKEKMDDFLSQVSSVFAALRAFKYQPVF